MLASSGPPLAAPIDYPSVAGIPIDFFLFAFTLAGIALFHHHTLAIAVTGMVIITLYKILFSPFQEGPGTAGWIAHLGHEWVLLANLLGLLLGFALSLILIFVINKQSFGWTIRFHWPVAILTGAIFLIFAATVLAGFYPARIAVQLNPVEVVHEE